MVERLRFRLSLLVSFFIISLVNVAFATNLLEPEEFKKWLQTGRKVIIVDIQPPEDFAKAHFKGSIETNAFPANTDELKRRLDKALPAIQSNPQDPVVIICPRGKSGAQNSYEYLKSKGIPEKRLFILKGGIAGWPYPELLQKGK